MAACSMAVGPRSRLFIKLFIMHSVTFSRTIQSQQDTTRKTQSVPRNNKEKNKI